MNTTVNTNEITMRQAFEATIAMLNGEPTKYNITKEDVVAKFNGEIAKLDATNAKRAEKAKAKAVEYEPIKSAIFEFLKVNGTKTTSEIAVAIEQSVPKTSAMARQMVDEGRLTASEVSVPKKGKQKAYTIVE